MKVDSAMSEIDFLLLWALISKIGDPNKTFKLQLGRINLISLSILIPRMLHLLLATESPKSTLSHTNYSNDISLNPIKHFSHSPHLF